MSITVTFNGATFRKPGARTRMIVDQTSGSPLSSAGTVAIVGEAVGGAPGSEEGVQTYNSTQLSDLVEKYLEGPIVDAAKALFNPSRDSRIANGAAEVVVYKTNQSTQSSATVQNIDDANAGDGDDLFDVTSKNYGADENQIYFTVSEGTTADIQPSLTSGVITFPLTLTATQTLVVNVNGTNYTMTVGSGADEGPHADIDALLTVLNDATNWSASLPVVFTEGDTADTLVCTLDTSLAAFDGFESQHEYGYMHIKGTGVELDCKFATTVAFATNGTSGGTFTVASTTGLSEGQFVRIDDGNSSEIEAVITDITGTTITVDSGATDLSGYTTAQTAVVYLGGSIVDPDSLEVTSDGTWGPMRGSRGTRVFTVVRNDTTETLDENDNDVRLIVNYIGASAGCTLSIADSGSTKVLTTTTSSPSTTSENLNIDLADYTIQELVNYIQNFGGGGIYNCVTTFFNAANAEATTLDVYSGINIVRLPLNIKGAMDEIETIVNDNSNLIDIARQTGIYGQLETVSTATYLTGAVAGASTNSNFQSGFDALLSVRANVVVPLISQDASDDISDGLTDEDSTYTVDAVNLQCDTHCRTASNTTNRSERLAFVSKLDTFANCRAAAKVLNSEFSQMVIQSPDVIDVNGDITTKQPYILASIAAGMRAGASVGESITFKYANINGITHDDYNDRTDTENALRDGLCVIETPDAGGFRFVLDNTTYGADQNFVFNRGNVFAAAQYVAYNLRQQIEDVFIGSKVTSNNGTSVKSLATQILTQFRDLDILVGDDTNDGLGFRDLVVTTTGNTTSIQVIITPVQANEFIPITLVLDTIRQTA